jgi:hypothetical protein
MKFSLIWRCSNVFNHFLKIMNLLNHVCFLHPMNMLHIWVATFFQCASLTKLNIWEEEWFITIKALLKKKKNNKNNNNKRERRIINDLVCKQYINACKLCAKLRFVTFKTIQVDQKNIFNFLIIIPNFSVIETCSKFNFGF